MTTNSEATNGYTGAQLGIRKQNENRRAHEILQRRSNVRFLVEKTVIKYFFAVLLEPPTSAMTYFTSQEDRTAAMQNIVLLCCVRPYADLEITIRCNLESVVQQTTCMNVVM